MLSVFDKYLQFNYFFFTLIRPQTNEYAKNIAAFNYMQPNSLIPTKIAQFNSSEAITDLHEKHLLKQQQFFADKKEKEAEKRNKKSKKDKSKKNVREDRILIHPNKEQPAQRFNIPPHHDYQNIIEEHEKLLKEEENKFAESNFRKFGDTGKLNEKKTRCAIQDGVYVFHNANSSGSSLTSFAEIENKKQNHDVDLDSSGKLKNFNLSKYLNIDVKSASPVDNTSFDLVIDKRNSDKQDNSSSSKSSSLSNKSVDSMEQAIIRNGLKNSDNQTNSYLGPFNFRKLLRPTGIAPTESLRKRKMIILNTSSPPPDKNLKTNCIF